ncbi:hypothetical protein ACQ4LE_000093 [Meloidogyne hapla]
MSKKSTNIRSLPSELLVNIIKAIKCTPSFNDNISPMLIKDRTKWSKYTTKLMTCSSIIYAFVGKTFLEFKKMDKNFIEVPENGYHILEAERNGFLDLKTGIVSLPGTDKSLTLEEALSLGVLNPSSVSSSVFFKVVGNGFVDHHGRRLTLQQAIIERIANIEPEPPALTTGSKKKLIQLSSAASAPVDFRPVGQPVVEESEGTSALSSIGVGPSQPKKQRLTGTVGDSYFGQEFSSPHFAPIGEQMTTADAVNRSIIRIGTVKSVDEPGERTNLARIIDSEEFDERSGGVLDPQTRRYLPFCDAVSRRLVDPDSLLHDLNSSKTITLREPLNLALIDSQGRYVPKAQPGQHTLISPVPLKEAVQRGLITLSSPMQAAQAVSEASNRLDAKGYKFRLELRDDAKLQLLSAGSGHEETITCRPQEPSLSVSSSGGYSGDGDVSLGGSRVRFGDIATLELKNLQNNFISLLQQQIFDVDEKCVENPSTKGMMSIREAVESGLFDVITGNLVHPISGHYYTIQTSQEKGQKLSDAYAQVHKKHEGLPGFRRSEQQFSTGSVVGRSKLDLIFSSSSGGFIDYDTKKFVPLDSAIRSGNVSLGKLIVVDALTGKEFTLTEAEEWGIVNIPRSYYFDKKDNKRYSFTEAVIKGKIYQKEPEFAADAHC